MPVGLASYNPTAYPVIFAARRQKSDIAMVLLQYACSEEARARPFQLAEHHPLEAYLEALNSPELSHLRPLKVMDYCGECLVIELSEQCVLKLYKYGNPFNGSRPPFDPEVDMPLVQPPGFVRLKKNYITPQRQLPIREIWYVIQRKGLPETVSDDDITAFKQILRQQHFMVTDDDPAQYRYLMEGVSGRKRVYLVDSGAVRFPDR